MSTKQAAPNVLLNMISCGCNAGCTNSCGCRKIGMDCPMCSTCQGQTCTNSPSILDNQDDVMIENDMNYN